MEKSAQQRRILDASDFAFVRFFAYQHPVFANLRTYSPTHMNVYHTHDFPQIWYCLSGKYIQRVENVVYECVPGSVVMIPPGVHHNISVPEGEMPAVMHFNVMYDLFADVPPKQYLNSMANLFLPPFTMELGHSFPIYRMLTRESQKIMEENISWMLSIRYNPPNQNINLDACDKLERIFSLPEFVLPEKCWEKALWLFRTRYLPIVRVLSYLNTNYGEKLGEDALLPVSGICHTELYRHFKRFTGYTISEYHRTLRVKHAYFYLKHTAYPLSYISDVCGFYNLSHMSRLFNKYMGQTPRDFRLEYSDWIKNNPEYKPINKVI